MSLHSTSNFDKTNAAEDWDDDNISIISNSHRSSLLHVAIRILLGALFLAAGVGAVVYSVVNSEQSKESEDFFRYSITQKSRYGNLSITYAKYEHDWQSNFTVSTTRLSWTQDAESGELFLRNGLKSFFYLEGYSYSISANCTKSDVGYDGFFRKLGLTSLHRREKAEQLEIAGGKKVWVRVYEGEPPEDAVVEGQRPRLVLAYSDVNNHATYRWEIFFDRSQKINKVEYWFPDMITYSGRDSVFDDIPPECTDLPKSH